MSTASWCPPQDHCQTAGYRPEITSRAISHMRQFRVRTRDNYDSFARRQSAPDTCLNEEGEARLVLTIFVFLRILFNVHGFLDVDIVFFFLRCVGFFCEATAEVRERRRQSPVLTSEGHRSDMNGTDFANIGNVKPPPWKNHKSRFHHAGRTPHMLKEPKKRYAKRKWQHTKINEEQLLWTTPQKCKREEEGEDEPIEECDWSEVSVLSRS
uniref:Uncharacterized protein n=1 Tax=Steinernema glaseri TaxID=37863 RepID=A0A1I8AWZ6_9BILA